MRKVLEDLIFLGATDDTVKVFGKNWKLQTLAADEHLSATNATSNYDTLSRIFALKIEILARSLKSIDDVNITDFVEGLEVARKLQPAIINRLYEEYEKLQQKQNTSLNDLDELKN